VHRLWHLHRKVPKRVVDEEFEAGLGYRKAIYRPSPRRCPSTGHRYQELHSTLSGASVKRARCSAPPRRSISSRRTKIITVEVGNVILATGYDLFDARRIPQYGYGRLANVFTSLEFERLVNAAGPTGGKIVLRDGVTTSPIRRHRSLRGEPG